MQQQPPQNDPLLDMPAGPPTNRDSSIPFFVPLEELVVKSAAQRERDMQEVNRFFHGTPPTVTKEAQRAIKETILVKKTRTDGELFTAMRRIDHPDVKAEPCGRPLTCGHFCAEPKVVEHECGRFCTSIKNFVRPCKHEMPIYCSRKEAVTECRNKCNKIVGCGHKCRQTCHYPSPCAEECSDFICKLNLDQRGTGVSNFRQ